MIHRLQNISELIEVSSRMGSDINLIQATGGNTSIKIDGYMIVKASGKHLANAFSENIFVETNPQDYYYNKNGDIKIINPKKSSIREGDLKPSIECNFHALLPKKIILHSHPIEIMAHTMLNSFHSKADLALKGMNWKYINYAKPGEALAMEIAKSMKVDNNIYILANHGLIVCADTVKEAERLQSNVINKLKLNRRVLKDCELESLENIVESIPDAYLPNNKIIHTLGSDEWSLELARKSAYSPDHAVFCGIYPLIIKDINQDWKRLMQGHTYAIIEGKGVILFENSGKYLEDMLLAQAEVFARIPVEESVTTLSINQCKDLVNWEAEKYRKKMLEKLVK